MRSILVPLKSVLFTAVFSSVLLGCLGCAALKVPSHSVSESSSIAPEGVFVAEMPSASGMGRLIAIHLFENGKALRTNIYIGEPDGDYLEEGSWSAEDNTVKLVLKSAAQPPVEVELILRLDRNGLTALKYDETRSGKKGIRFTRIPDNHK